MTPNGERLLMIAINTDPSVEDWLDILEEEYPAEEEHGEALWGLAGEIAERRRRQNNLIAALKLHRAQDISEYGATQYGGTYITTAPDSKRIVDREGLVAWATHIDPDAVPKLWRLDTKALRITAVRALAKTSWLREHPDGTDEEADAYARVIEDTFISVEKGERTLVEMPIDKAPQWAQELDHAQRAGSFRNVTPEE